MTIQVEVSVYPLKTEEPIPVINTFCRMLKQGGHKIHVGSMSTELNGESNRVFISLKRAFEHVAEDHDVVMIVKYSNACPEIGN